MMTKYAFTENFVFKKCWKGAFLAGILFVNVYANNKTINDMNEFNHYIKTKNLQIGYKAGPKSCWYIDNAENFKNFLKTPNLFSGTFQEYFAEFLKDDPKLPFPGPAYKSKEICTMLAEESSLFNNNNYSSSCRGKDVFEFFKNATDKDPSDPEKCGVLNEFLKSEVASIQGLDKNELENKSSADFGSSFPVFGQGISCRHMGTVTVDYLKCVEFAQAFITATQAQGAVQGIQEVWAQNQTGVAFQEAQGKADDPKAALNAQKTGLEAQRTVAQQRATIEATKLSYLMKLYNEIPSPEQLDGKFKVLQDPRYGVFLNQDTKNKFKGQLMAVGGQAASQMLIANIANNRVGSIDDMMAKVDAFKPPEYNPTMDDARVVYCQQNPLDAKCSGNTAPFEVNPFAGDVVQFSNGGTGTSYTDGAKIDGITTGNSNASNSISNNSSNPLGIMGSAITPIDKTNSITDKSLKAVVTEGSGPQSAGGGGLGGGGGGGGGGGSPLPTPKKEGDTIISASGGSIPKYFGGTGVSVLGGSGINNKKSQGKDDANPFNNLFNNKTAGSGSGVLNLRGIASEQGKTGGSVLDQIARQYQQVKATEGRLLEYQSTKP